MKYCVCTAYHSLFPLYRVIAFYRVTNIHAGGSGGRSPFLFIYQLIYYIMLLYFLKQIEIFYFSCQIGR